MVAVVNARSIKLAFTAEDADRGYDRVLFETPFAQRTIWPKLRGLSLSNLEVKASDIVRLLKVYAKTLEIVRLGHMNLKFEDLPGGDGEGTPEDIEQEDLMALYVNGIRETSWNPDFDALRALPKLKDVVFWGGLKNQGSCWRCKGNPKYKPKSGIFFH